VGNVFAHDVPLIHARRCKGVRWLIKNEQQRKQGRGEKLWATEKEKNRGAGKRNPENREEEKQGERLVTRNRRKAGEQTEEIPRNRAASRRGEKKTEPRGKTEAKTQAGRKKNWGVKLKPRLEAGAERRRKHRGAELRNP